jgi:hypothetical protein
MRTRFLTTLSLGAMLALIGALTLSSVVLGAETTLSATLAGTGEIPPGDTDGAGTASVVIVPAAGTVCYDITTKDIAAATMSHIHVGAAGVAGDVVVPLDTDGFDGATKACTEGQDAAALQAIIDNPAGYYVNVHNADFPGGAVRGQLAAGTVPNTALPHDAGSSPALLGFILLGIALIASAWRISAQRR